MLHACNDTRIVGGTQSEELFTELNPDREYLVEIKAATKIGYGPSAFVQKMAGEKKSKLHSIIVNNLQNCKKLVKLTLKSGLSKHVICKIVYKLLKQLAARLWIKRFGNHLTTVVSSTSCRKPCEHILDIGLLLKASVARCAFLSVKV